MVASASEEFGHKGRDYGTMWPMRMMLIGLIGFFVIAAAPVAAQQGGASNTLTAAEQKEGFELLFDGKSLDKFIVPADQTKVWRVVNGVIRNEQAAPGATILTKEDFGNFVVRAEFRAHPGVNSALMLRQGRPQPAGYELQIRDKLLTDRTGGSYLTGSIVNVQNAPEGTKIVPGQWNTFEATLNGDHIVVLYNGAKVVDVHDARQSDRRDRPAVGASRGSGGRLHRVPQSENQAAEINCDVTILVHRSQRGARLRRVRAECAADRAGAADDSAVAGQGSRRAWRCAGRYPDADDLHAAEHDRPDDRGHRRARWRLPRVVDEQGRTDSGDVSELAGRRRVRAEVPAWTEVSPSDRARRHAACDSHAAIARSGVAPRARPHRRYGLFRRRASRVDGVDAVRSRQARPLSIRSIASAAAPISRSSAIR